MVIANNSIIVEYHLYQIKNFVLYRLSNHFFNGTTAFSISRRRLSKYVRIYQLSRPPTTQVKCSKKNYQQIARIFRNWPTIQNSSKTRSVAMAVSR